MGISKAISTTFFGPSNVKGSRIRAKAPDNPARFFEYEHELHHIERHAAVAKAYATIKGWPGLYVGGYVDKGYVWVNGGTMGGNTEDVAEYFGIEGQDWFFVEEKAR